MKKGVFVPLNKVNIGEGKVLDIEIKRKFSARLSKFRNIIKSKKIDKAEEAYHE